MNKTPMIAFTLALILTSCASPFQQPAPAPSVVQDTIVIAPTWTAAPSVTPVVAMPTSAEAQILQAPASDTPLSAALDVSTNTLAPATVSVNTVSDVSIYPTVTMTPSLGAYPTVTMTPGGYPTVTMTPGGESTPYPTLFPQHYGTVPPDPPRGTITVINRAKADLYISFQCTGPDGLVTIIEYPVYGILEFKAPIGQYHFVVWVGGNQMSGDFRLRRLQDLTIQVFKNKIEFGKQRVKP